MAASARRVAAGGSVNVNGNPNERRSRVRRTGLRVAFSLAFVLVAGGPACGSTSEFDSGVGSILDALESNRYTIPRAVEELTQLPRDAAIENLAEEIAQGERRRTAYFLLTHLRAAETPAGRDLLLAGLEDADPGIRTYCAQALGLPGIDSDRVAVSVGRALAGEPDPGVRRELLRSLGRAGTPAAAPYLGTVRVVFHDPGSPEAHRSFAASALLQVDGLSRAIAEFDRADVEGTHAALEALIYLGAKTRLGFGTDMAGREVVADFVLETTASDDVATRRTSMQALAFLLGPKGARDAPEQLTCNRRIRETLARRVESESDPAVARMMRHYLTNIRE